jgi:hypothetical protein
MRAVSRLRILYPGICLKTEVNSRDYIVGLFIREKNCFEISVRQSEGEGRGRVRVENQAIYGKYPKWRPLVFM